MLSVILLYLTPDLTGLECLNFESCCYTYSLVRRACGAAPVEFVFSLQKTMEWDVLGGFSASLHIRNGLLFEMPMAVVAGMGTERHRAVAEQLRRREVRGSRSHPAGWNLYP